MTPLLATDLPLGQRALLQSDASRDRANALGLTRAPMHAADAEMGEKRREAAKTERVLIRARRVWIRRGFHTVPDVRYDVLRCHGLSTEIVAANCVWFEEAVQLATNEARGRISVGIKGQRYTFGAQGQKVVDAVTTLAGESGAGWKKPEPGEVLVVK